MRVAIDASALAKPAPGGIARYVRELVSAISRIDRDDRFTLAYRLSRIRGSRHFLEPPAANFRARIFQEPILLTLGRFDVFHGPDARVPRTRRAALIATVHDLFSVVTESFAGAAFREKKLERYAALVQRCRLLLAVSEHTRRLCVERLGADPARVLVTPEGVSDAFRPPDPAGVDRVRKRYGISEDYLLFVGELSRRKNLVRLLDAFAALKRPGALRLVIAGRPSYGHEEVLAAIERLRLADAVVRPGFVPAEDLPALYGGARAFVLPSLDEGFGLPVLEAMACGTPVLASNRGAIPEVAGDAALLFDPECPDDIRNTIASFLEDDATREELCRRGLERARAFTWERTARLTLEAYRRAAGDGSRAPGE